MYPRTFIFGAKAAAGYKNAKLTIKLINSVAEVINNDKSINNKIKVVFIEDYKVSNAEWIFAAADVSEQISTASKEASGTGNMKFMLNGALTLGTMDGANVEMYEEVGPDNMFIFGMSSDEVIAHEHNRDYDPMQIFNTDQDIRKVLTQLVNGFYSPNDSELFRDLYNSLLNTHMHTVRGYLLHSCRLPFLCRSAEEDHGVAYKRQERLGKERYLKHCTFRQVLIRQNDSGICG